MKNSVVSIAPLFVASIVDNYVAPTVLQFLYKKYEGSKYRTEKYGSNKKFGFEKYILEHRRFANLDDYLTQFQGKTIDIKSLNSLMKEVMIRKIPIERFLYSMQLHSNVDLPIEFGIATAQYWLAKFPEPQAA
jgi:predicted glycosyl hydrolase (DUF1957 family)